MPRDFAFEHFAWIQAPYRFRASGRKCVKGALRRAGMLRSAAMLALSCLLPGMSFAQVASTVPAQTNNAAAAQIADSSIPVIMITGQHYDNAVGSSDAASEGVVLGELLLDRPLLRPGEVLETVPGHRM